MRTIMLGLALLSVVALPVFAQAHFDGYVYAMEGSGTNSPRNDLRVKFCLDPNGGGACATDTTHTTYVPYYGSQIGWYATSSDLMLPFGASTVYAFVWDDAHHLWGSESQPLFQESMSGE